MCLTYLFDLRPQCYKLVSDALIHYSRMATIITCAEPVHIRIIENKLILKVDASSCKQDNYIPMEPRGRSYFGITYAFQTLEERGSVELVVKVTGQPEPQVKWYHKDVELQPTVKVHMVDEDDGVHKLTITSVTMAMAEEYKAVATNVAGQVEHVATVTITGRFTSCHGSVNIMFYNKHGRLEQCIPNCICVYNYYYTSSYIYNFHIYSHIFSLRIILNTHLTDTNMLCLPAS